MTESLFFDIMITINCVNVYRFDSEFLCNVANRIINEARGINRVVYDFTSKPPGTIEWE